MLINSFSCKVIAVRRVTKKL
ncbi:hypothetical protein [Orientia tsutsugamushi]